MIIAKDIKNDQNYNRDRKADAGPDEFILGRKVFIITHRYLLFDAEHFDFATFRAFIELHIQRARKKIVPVFDEQSPSAELDAVCTAVIHQNTAVRAIDLPNLSNCAFHVYLTFRSR